MSPPTVGGGGASDGGGDYYPFPPPFPYPFHLLELTVISAQDLYPALRSSMRTYAVAWIDEDHKLRTRLDPVGHTEPTWNDKFVFRVDDSTLRSDTSAITIDVFAARSKLRPGSDTLLGTARALLSTLRPAIATRFVALQIRRPTSLRPQGMLNVGFALLDAYVRTLPTYSDLGSEKGSEEVVVRAKPPPPPAVRTLHAVRPPSAVRPPPAGRPPPAARVEERKKGVKPVKVVGERGMVERKLEKWKAELPAVKDEEGVEERGMVERKLAKWKAELPAVKDEEDVEERRMRGKSRRTAGRMFCCATPEEEKGEGEGKGQGGGAKVRLV